ncbi:MAG: hypothetical protein N3C60_10005 [Calditerrivibrio sp.]|nr:hypothetical protein [Calditerrivibrio sp.]
MAFIGDFSNILTLLKKIYDNNKALSEFLKSRYSDIFKIDSYDSYKKLPILRKSDYSNIQRNNPPFGGLIADKPIKIFQSPGPINNVKIEEYHHYRFYKALRYAGFNSSDIVVNTFGYTLTPAGEMFDEACKFLEIPIFPLGPTDSAKAAEIIDTFGATAFIGTKTFLLKVAEQTKRKTLKKAYLIAEKITEEDRKYIANSFGIEAYQGYGIAEVGLIATEERGKKYMLLDTDALFVEHLEPNDNNETDLEEYGELVLTFLDERLPFLRFATGDIVSYEGTRLKGVFGRADSSIKVKGVFVHYWQFEEFCAHLGIKGRLIVEPSDKSDIIILEMSTSSEDAIEEFKRRFGLRVNGTKVSEIEKNEIIDKREWKKE